jgi:ABC-type polar amino acid transport system ATPase subunit
MSGRGRENRHEGDVFVRVADLAKRYGAHEVLRGISFDVRRGEVLVVCGPSGCGKSTMLRCINGLETFDSGDIVVNGLSLRGISAADMMQVRLSTGFVFQSFNLFPHKTALQNIMLAPVSILKQSRVEAECIARALLERVGIPEKADEYPFRLSGGQRQRVAIARALAMKPKLMLFDEPTSALDPEMREEVLSVIKALRDEENMTMIIVTHEIGFGRSVGDLAMMMEGGRIVELDNAATLFSDPRHERTRRFLKSIINA